MSKKLSSVDIVRAWKDAAYRNSLSAEQRAMVPANPAGMVEVDDAELAMIDGGRFTITCNGCTVICTREPRPKSLSTAGVLADSSSLVTSALAAPTV